MNADELVQQEQRGYRFAKALADIGETADAIVEAAGGRDDGLIWCCALRTSAEEARRRAKEELSERPWDELASHFARMAGVLSLLEERREELGWQASTDDADADDVGGDWNPGFSIIYCSDPGLCIVKKHQWPSVEVPESLIADNIRTDYTEHEQYRAAWACSGAGLHEPQSESVRLGFVPSWD